MNKTPPTKPNRRKPASQKLAPIDWHEYANDAVLNGNMSTLFHRPATEDPSAYASPEALLEIEKRAPKPASVTPPPPVRPLPVPVAVVGKKIKPLRTIQDALTLAGQILYQAMYGVPEDAGPRACAKGYRQLAAETHLDKDTVRDLIADFKAKGMLREIGSYNPDTRTSKTYEVLAPSAILEMWRDAGILYVTAGRQRPEFCTAQGQPQPL